MSGALAPDARRSVVRASLSVGVATGAYGVSFGALAVAAGLNIWQACAMSLLMFTGGSQFAFIGIIGTGLGAAPAAIAASSLLGVRNGFYALELTQLLGVRGWRRVAAAHVTIDESTAVAVTQQDVRAGRLGFWVTGISVFLLWNLMTLVGALIGDALGDPKSWGLDGAASAAQVATMSLWTAVIVAAAIAFVLKLAGYLVPMRVFEGARTKRLTAALPIALLAALIGTQTFVTDGAVVLDARAAAVAVAAIALLLRAPFILVVILGAATAAGLRLLGWAA